MGTLKLYGYLRGRNLDVNSLLHLPALGTYQMSEIYVLNRAFDKNNNLNGEAWELLGKCDPSKQESLETEAHYDEMNAEQTWPTEQELKEGKCCALGIT
jgi:pre-rRNA-processing protein TSR1